MNRILYIFVVMLFCGIAINSSAENRCYIEDFTIEPGETKDISLMLENDVIFAAFQADVTLPEGLEFVYNEDEYDYCWFNADRINYKAFSCTTAFQDEPTNKVLRMAVSFTKEGAEITGNEGGIMYVRVKAADDFSGKQTITLSNVIFTQADETQYKLDSTEAIVSIDTVFVESITLDAVTLSLDPTDTVELIATIAPESAANKSINWTSSNDAVATVDANGLVTAIGGGTATITAAAADGSGCTATCMVTVSGVGNSFYVEDFTISAGETKDIPLMLKNNVTFVAFQADVTLPEGLEFVYNEDEYDYCWFNADRINAKAFSCATAFQDESERELRMAVAFTKLNATITGNSGAVMYVRIRAKENFSGSHTIILDDVIFTQADETQYKLDSTEAQVTTPDWVEPTGVELTLTSALNGTIGYFVEKGTTQSLRITPNDGYKIHSLAYNGVDVIDLLVDNVYTTPVITEASTLNVAFEIATSIETVKSDNVKVIAFDGNINIYGTIPGEFVNIFTVDGLLIESIVSNGDTLNVAANNGVIYVVKTANHQVKVMM